MSGQIIMDVSGKALEGVQSVGDPGTKYVALSASASDIANYTTMKGLRIYNTTATSGITVVGASEASDATPYEINFSAGNFYEPLRIRKLTVIDAGITVHAVF